MRIGSEIRRCTTLTNDELWNETRALAKGERGESARFLIHLAEIKLRDLHVERAYPGLYHFLLSLGFSEWDARARSLAATAAMKYRSIYGLVASGRVTLTALSIVLPYVTPENHRMLLRKACRRTARELKILVAGLAPNAPKRDTVRVVSAPPPRPELSAQATEPTARPESPGTVIGSTFPADSLFPGAPLSRFEKRPAGEVRYRLSFDCSAELEAKLQRAKELLSNKYPSMRLEFVLADAVEALLDKIDRERRHARRVARLRLQDLGRSGMAGSA